MESVISSSYAVANETLELLTPEWLALLQRSGTRSPFLQPSWLRVWHAERAADEELSILTVRDGAALLGIVPLLKQGEELRLAGDSEICDYMDLITEPGLHGVVLRAALDYLEDQDWRRLSFWGLRADSPTLTELGPAAKERGLEITVAEEAVCPRVSLPTTWEDYLLTLSKKDRHELRRKIRRLSQAGGTIEEYALSDPDEIAAAMPDFFRLHTISRHDKAEFMTSDMERFFMRITAALSRDDLIRLFFLELDGQRVATVLAFDCGDELWLYNSGFDPAYASVSVGLVSKALVLRHAIEAGKRCYDFLRGAESYKYDLGAQDLPVYQAALSRPDHRFNSKGADGGR